MSQRGKIYNAALATQIRDFSGLRYGSITPTDIDGLLDFQDRAYVIIETKLCGAQVPYGQRLAIARLTDIISSTGRLGMALIARHKNTFGEIDFANCAVSEYRYGGQWIIPRADITVRQAVDRILERLNKPTARSKG